MGADLKRIAAVAAESFLGDGKQPTDRREENQGRRFGGVGALALGVGLAVAARAAYKRARRLDLEQVADSIEDKLS